MGGAGSAPPASASNLLLSNTSRQAQRGGRTATADYVGDKWQFSGQIDLSDAPWAIESQQSVNSKNPGFPVETEALNNVFVDWGDGTVEPLTIQWQGQYCGNQPCFASNTETSTATQFDLDVGYEQECLRPRLCGSGPIRCARLHVASSGGPAAGRIASQRRGRRRRFVRQIDFPSRIVERGSEHGQSRLSIDVSGREHSASQRSGVEWSAQARVDPHHGFPRRWRRGERPLEAATQRRAAAAGVGAARVKTAAPVSGAARVNGAAAAQQRGARQRRGAPQRPGRRLRCRTAVQFLRSQSRRRRQSRIPGSGHGEIELVSRMVYR